MNFSKIITINTRNNTREGAAVEKSNTCIFAIDDDIYLCETGPEQICGILIICH